MPRWAIQLEFTQVTPRPYDDGGDFSITSVHSPSRDEYREAFRRVSEHLERGDCYQVNLTFPFEVAFEGPPQAMVNKLWRGNPHAGPYAHATFLPTPLLPGLVGQSPECLFQAVHGSGSRLALQTMPIKGSAPLRPGDSPEKKWRQLAMDTKEEGELFMIADLLRNDLNRIEFPRARVLKKKAPLVVPGILHQYSLIEIALSRGTTLREIMRALFPGGSVTGAPKKRVMEIIRDVEGRDRGLYCGTTFIHHEGIFRGNINIRTAQIHRETKRLNYSAGGGVTLLRRFGKGVHGDVGKGRELFSMLPGFSGKTIQNTHKKSFLKH